MYRSFAYELAVSEKWIMKQQETRPPSERCEKKIKEDEHIYMYIYLASVSIKATCTS